MLKAKETLTKRVPLESDTFDGISLRVEALNNYLQDYDVLVSLYNTVMYDLRMVIAPVDLFELRGRTIVFDNSRGGGMWPTVSEFTILTALMVEAILSAPVKAEGVDAIKLSLSFNTNDSTMGIFVYKGKVWKQ